MNLGLESVGGMVLGLGVLIPAAFAFRTLWNKEPNNRIALSLVIAFWMVVGCGLIGYGFRILTE